MLIFQVVTWVLFGIAIGTMFAFFMEKRGHTPEHLVAGAGGAFLGGILGLFISSWLPRTQFQAGGYSFTALFLALLFSLLFIFIERKTHRRGRFIFRDPRPDVP